LYYFIIHLIIWVLIAILEARKRLNHDVCFVIILFLTLGGIIWCHKLAHINNPWFLRMIFIGLLMIIIIIVINVQINKVRNMVAKPSRSYPYHVPQYWMIYFLMKLIHVETTTTWCLHKFPRNAHSHVQQAYLVKGNGTLYVILKCYWLRTIHAWLIFFKSSIPWVTWDQCGLLNAHFHNVFHNFIFYKPTFLHFSRVLVMFYNHCCEFLDINQLIYQPWSPFVSKENQHFNAPW
jgi:hypothetical protein